MKNIVLTACSLVLAGSICQVMAEDKTSETSKGHFEGKTGENTTGHIGVAKIIPGNIQVLTDRKTRWKMDVLFTEHEDCQPSDNSCKYDIRVSLKGMHTDTGPSWTWKDVEQGYGESGPYNVRGCFKHMQEHLHHCLDNIVNTKLKMEIESSKDKEDPHSVGAAFPFSVTGEFENCGDTEKNKTSCSFS